MGSIQQYLSKVSNKHLWSRKRFYCGSMDPQNMAFSDVKMRSSWPSFSRSTDPYDLTWCLSMNSFCSLTGLRILVLGQTKFENCNISNNKFTSMKNTSIFFSVPRQVKRARFVAGCGFGPQALAGNSRPDTERRGSTPMARCSWILMKVVLKNGSKGELQLTRKKVTARVSWCSPDWWEIVIGNNFGQLKQNWNHLDILSWYRDI